jgi:phytoene dehydrogenase-like protein
VGAGYSGLSCAYQLSKKGHEVTVLEKSEHVSGRAHSEVFEGERINLGAVLMTPRYDTTWSEYLEEFGLEDEVKGDAVVGPPLMGIMCRGRGKISTRIDKIPFALSRYIYFRDILRLAQLQFSIRKWSWDHENYSRDVATVHNVSTAEFFRRMGFSEEFIHIRMCQPLMGFLGNKEGADKIAASLGVRVFALGFAKNALPKGGMDIIGRALHERLGDKVVLGAEVQSVTQAEKGFTLHYAKDGRKAELQAELVVLAIPPPYANRLFPGLDIDWGYGSYYVVVVKGKVKPKYKKLRMLAISRYEEPSNVLAFVQPRADSEVSCCHVWEKPYDLSHLYDQYEVLKEVHWDIECANPRPGQAFPSLETKFEGLYICGDITVNPNTDAALWTGRKVAELIDSKYPIS